MHRSPSYAVTMAGTLLGSTILELVLLASIAGCGSGELQVDKAALYTPAALAQELVFRYSALKPEGKKSKRKVTAADVKRLAAVKRAAAAEKKEGTTEANTKKAGRPRNVDDLLDEIGTKIDLIKETSRAETCRQMADAISKEGSLTDSDKQLLTEKLRELGGAS